MQNEALRMENITKVYPNGVVANKDIMFSARKGEIHALSGENGAGKSTLMKILFGEEEPTRGSIFVNRNKVNITSSAVAIRLGIGMVHQHFMLVPSLSVIENMVLGVEPKKGIFLDKKLAEKKVIEISEKYNLLVPPHAKIHDLTVGQKQKVEILKALLHGARILILDEPTAVLTPQETRELFVELKMLREDGYTIVFISHKLNEVKELCDRITIIRHGQTMGVFDVDKVSEAEISRLMVGRDVVLNIEKQAASAGATALEVRDLVVADNYGKPIVNGISYNCHNGEIFGVAGVEGNGQSELVEVLSGIRPMRSGSVKMNGKEIAGMSITRLRSNKVCHIPEDRMTVGIAADLSISENMLADKTADRRFFSKLGLLKRNEIKKYGREMIERYQISCQSADVPVSSLSGGNIQKVVLARELSGDPEIIVANQPTRGVDVGASEFIRKELIALRDNGKCVFLVSSDLNELLGLSDKLIVLYNGKITAFFSDVSRLSEETLGRYMLGIDSQSEEQIREAAQ